MRAQLLKQQIICILLKAIPAVRSLSAANPRNVGTRSMSNSILIAEGLNSRTGNTTKVGFTREDFLSGLIGTGTAAIVAAVVSPAIQIVTSPNRNPFPREQEKRISDLFERTFLEAAGAMSAMECASAGASGPTDQFLSPRPLRVLEVGIGGRCRSVLHGLYDNALLKLSEEQGDADASLASSSPGDKKSYTPSLIEFTGVDIDTPNEEYLEMSREWLSMISPIPVSFNVVTANIEDGLEQFEDGYFDAITCSMVLCSVADQSKVLGEIKRLLNKNGGIFGYIEHVAARTEVLLGLQQVIFDPIQKRVSHNCHLHRKTDDIIARVFNINGPNQSHLISNDRFEIKDMWPCSMQCSGIIKLRMTK